MRRARWRAAPALLAPALLLAAALAQTGEAPGPTTAREEPIELPTIRVEAVREQIREVGERWRVDPPDDQRWRERGDVERPGRIVWGYDSVHEMRRVEREWLEPEPHPELYRTRPVTVLNVRF